MGSSLNRVPTGGCPYKVRLCLHIEWDKESPESQEKEKGKGYEKGDFERTFKPGANFGSSGFL